MAVSHWEELDETALVLDAEPEMDEIERIRLQAALLHPSVRSEIEHELAALALCTSQKSSRKATTPAVPKATRRERASKWRETLDKKTVTSILAGLPPGT